MNGHPIRVLVDATNLRPEMTGQRTYTLGLVSALSGRPDVDLVVVTSVPSAFEGLHLRVAEVSASVRHALKRAIWRELRLRHFARMTRAQLVLVPSHELPLRQLPLPAVIAVHDVGALMMPSLYPFRVRARHALALRCIVRNAARVLCLTHAARSSMLKSLAGDSTKYRVVGAGPQLDSAGAPGFGRADRRQYVLYVGALFRHKNVETLLHALAECDELALELVGPVTEEELSSMYSLVAELGLDGRVRHHGFVERDELASLYRGALLLALPSLSEGFGLPVIEAMAAGIPVVASDIDALSEVAGDAAILIRDPLDAGLWATAIRDVASNAELRARLTDAGRSRARAYQWDAVAAQVVGVFSEVLG